MTTNRQVERYVSLPRAANELHVSLSRAIGFIRQRRLRARFIDAAWQVDATSLRQLIRARWRAEHAHRGNRTTNTA